MIVKFDSIPNFHQVLPDRAATVAQLLEHSIMDPDIKGSNPVTDWTLAE
jgi:hypothetical protein